MGRRVFLQYWLMVIALVGCADPASLPESAEAPPPAPLNDSSRPTAMNPDGDTPPESDAAGLDVALPSASMDATVMDMGEVTFDMAGPSPAGDAAPEQDMADPAPDAAAIPDAASAMDAESPLPLDMALEPDAAPPPVGPQNDLCTNAAVIPTAGQHAVRASTRRATPTEMGLPTPDRLGPDLWYRFTLNAATEVTLHMAAIGDWDPYLLVYRGACAALVEVAENDDERPGVLDPRLSNVFPAGRYFVRAAGYDRSESGGFDLSARFAEPIYLDEAFFGATHNSYSGEARRSIEAQLDHGIRLLEFDIHDDDYANRGDFRIGHDRPDDEVDGRAPNPASAELSDWLSVVADWSEATPDHAPLFIVLDFKDNAANNHSFGQGNLAALNATIESVFGDRLVWAADVSPRGAGWPTVGQLRDRILVIISGHAASRRGYRDDQGFRPAVAMNTRGTVVEVHDDGNDTLWYWQGTYVSATDTIRWTNHGRYDSGIDPDVAINRNGVVVEVHKSQNRDRLYYRIGRIRADGHGIDFNDSRDYDDGIVPTIEFIDDGRVREIHQSQNNRQRWVREGTVNVVDGTIDWYAHERTDAPLPDKTATTVNYLGRDRTVSVRRRDADDRLRYQTGNGPDTPIQYPQIAFVEGQPGDDWIGEDIRFFAAGSGGDAERFLRDWMNRGGLVRQWNYNAVNEDFVPHFPATDFPFAQWYTDHLDALGAVAQ